jgi:hypothetical protein
MRDALKSRPVRPKCSPAGPPGLGLAPGGSGRMKCVCEGAAGTGWLSHGVRGGKCPAARESNSAPQLLRLWAAATGVPSTLCRVGSRAGPHSEGGWPVVGCVLLGVLVLLGVRVWWGGAGQGRAGSGQQGRAAPGYLPPAAAGGHS